MGDLDANQRCDQTSRRPERRWLRGFFALLLLLILGWFGWEKYRLRLLQTAAPVISIAADGTVSINGRKIIIGADGLPPEALALVEGGPPVEVQVPGQMVVTAGVKISHLDASWTREWHYPRTGLRVTITRQWMGRRVQYAGMLQVRRDIPCTLEMRGQRWWLGRPGPLGPLKPGDFGFTFKDLNFDERATSFLSEYLQAGDTRVVVTFEEAPSLRRLLRLGSQECHLDGADVVLRRVQGIPGPHWAGAGEEK